MKQWTHEKFLFGVYFLLEQNVTLTKFWFDSKYSWPWYVTFDLINSSQLAKMKKEYFWHVPAIKFIGMKQLV